MAGKFPKVSNKENCMESIPMLFLSLVGDNSISQNFQAAHRDVRAIRSVGSRVISIGILKIVSNNPVIEALKRGNKFAEEKIKPVREKDKIFTCFSFDLPWPGIRSAKQAASANGKKNNQAKSPIFPVHHDG